MYVSDVQSGSQLAVGDVLLAVNELPVEKLSREQVLQLVATGPAVTLTVARRDPRAVTTALPPPPDAREDRGPRPSPPPRPLPPAPCAVAFEHWPESHSLPRAAPPPRPPPPPLPPTRPPPHPMADSVPIGKQSECGDESLYANLVLLPAPPTASADWKQRDDRAPGGSSSGAVTSAAQRNVTFARAEPSPPPLPPRNYTHEQRFPVAQSLSRSCVLLPEIRIINLIALSLKLYS